MYIKLAVKLFTYICFLSVSSEKIVQAVATRFLFFKSKITVQGKFWILVNASV